jgi:hypothetical protein
VLERVRREVGKNLIVQSVCVDVDVDGDKMTYEQKVYAWIRYCKAVYQYSFIPRMVLRTRHGFHVWFEGLDFGDFYQILAFRSVFGDDPYRLMWDDIKYHSGFWVNRCFRNSELYEVRV